MHHVGYWVPDLAAAADLAASTLGVGPFLVHRHVRFDSFRLADGTEITDAAYLDHSAAFAAWGPVVLELAEVHSVDPALAEAYGIAYDRTGHVSWVTDDPDAEGARLRKAGCRLIHTASAGSSRSVAEGGDSAVSVAEGGDSAVSVAWYTGGRLFPHPIELHRAGPPILGMHARLAALAQGWDGRDLLRPI